MAKNSCLLLALLALPCGACTPESSPSKRDAPEPTSLAKSVGSSSPAAEKKLTAPEPAQAPGVTLPDGGSLWAGTIGETQVVVQLRIRKGKVGGRYFYTKLGRSLILEGSVKGDELTLEEQGGGADTIFGPALAQLQLKSIGSELRGEWKSLAGEKKALPVVLRRELKSEYDDLRVDRKDPPVTSKDGTIKTQSSAFLVEHLLYCKTDVPPPVSLDLIPGLKVLEDECHFAFEGKAGKRIIIEGTSFAILEAKEGLKWEEANRMIAPTLSFDPGETWEGSLSVKVLHAEGHMLTVEHTTSGLGLGAYPDHNHYGQSFDLRTGKALSWQDLLTDPASSEFRSALLKQQETASKSEDCNWTEIWSADDKEPPLYPHLDSEGLLVTPSFPHVSRACQYEAFGTRVPKELAKKYAKEGSLLAELLSGK